MCRLNRQRLLGRVDGDGFGVDDSGVCELCELDQINMQLLVRVLSRTVPRQHARVRRLKRACDERQVNVGHRMDAEELEDGNVGVAATDEHEQSGAPSHHRLQTGARLQPPRRDARRWHQSGWTQSAELFTRVTFLLK